MVASRPLQRVLERRALSSERPFKVEIDIRPVGR